MKHTTDSLGRLSKAEMDVMQAIWGMATPVTVPQMLGILSVKHGWKASTLSTIMERLMEKGFLTITKHGKPNIYSPLLSEQAYKEHETRSFLRTVHNGSVRSFISALSDGSGISDEEFDDIRAWFLQEKAGDK